MGQLDLKEGKLGNLDFKKGLQKLGLRRSESRLSSQSLESRADSLSGSKKEEDEEDGDSIRYRLLLMTLLLFPACV